MTIRLGDTAPDFTAKTTHGVIRFHAWKAGRWAVLFSYCRDCTLVCPTDLDTVAALKPEFEKRNTQVIGLSVASLDAYYPMPADQRQMTSHLNFPIIADPNREVTRLYGTVQADADDTVALHSVLLIDPDNKVRLSLTYPASIRPNFEDLPRVIDSLQITARHTGTTSAARRGAKSMSIPPAAGPGAAGPTLPMGFSIEALDAPTLPRAVR